MFDALQAFDYPFALFDTLAFGPDKQVYLRYVRGVEQVNIHAAALQPDAPEGTLRAIARGVIDMAEQVPDLLLFVPDDRFVQVIAFK